MLNHLFGFVWVVMPATRRRFSHGVCGLAPAVSPVRARAIPSGLPHEEIPIVWTSELAPKQPAVKKGTPVPESPPPMVCGLTPVLPVTATVTLRRCRLSLFVIHFCGMHTL